MSEVIFNVIGGIDDATARNLITGCQGLDESVSKITLNISSHGGNILPAINIYNFLKSVPKEVHTHNLGNISSSAIILFLSGSTRTGEDISSIMFHPVELTVNGTFSYNKIKEFLSITERDINDYARIISRELPEFCKRYDIYELLKNYNLTLSSTDCRSIGIYTN